MILRHIRNHPSLIRAQTTHRRIMTPQLASTTHLNAQTAQQIDDALMSKEHGFSIDQLMELAGQSCAHSVHDAFPPLTHKKVLVVCGPGNNGGDGLVAARHLSLMDYSVSVCYPKRNEKPLFKGLLAQCVSFGIPLVEWSTSLLQSSDIVLDAVFGFSFSGEPREPFASIIRDLSSIKNQRAAKIISIDIPSGWHVEQGDVDGTGIKPDALISLTAPKEGVKGFTGAHYLGGRFISPKIKEQFGLHLPPFPGSASFVRLDSNATQEAIDTKKRVADMRLSYERGGIDENDAQFSNKDPVAIFKEWFDEACALKASLEPNWISLASCSLDHRPSVRAVLLKGFDEEGFVVFTNYDSRKGRELISNPHASFCVYWETLQRQIRVEGTVEKLSPKESDEYFSSRPRSSQIGALVSQQSQAIASRAEIEAKDAELKAKYADESIPIPRPEHWGGIRIKPVTIEFWQGRIGRLHDRITFNRKTPTDVWQSPQRLQP